FLAIYFVVWLIKQAGKNNPNAQGGYRPPLPTPEEMARYGKQPAAPLALPPGNTLLLSADTSYASLDEAMIVAAFMRTEGSHDGEPAAAVWRRGPVIVRYRFDASVPRRELTFEGDGWENARQQVAGKVTWLRG
ncbi:MAG TPA: hypothetical protein VMZ28_17945, partial [Kofleriaceae bacterium]|nr:hypothetical protein [Kofleriaceae bacterium]